jgi:hypothetical protein
VNGDPPIHELAARDGDQLRCQATFDGNAVNISLVGPRGGFMAGVTVDVGNVPALVVALRRAGNDADAIFDVASRSWLEDVEDQADVAEVPLVAQIIERARDGALVSS